ncbi:MAG: NnrU family protein [Candidatus Binataceae bacterium]|jgi:uncharacterized membrane protein
MDVVGQIAFWTALFLITHLGISSAEVRPRMIKALGANAFRGIYSLISLVTFIPLIVVFGYHKHAGPMIWNLRPVLPARVLAWLLMLAAVILLVDGIIHPAPSSMGARVSGKARGIIKLTRHPLFVASVLFGLAHMLMNGWAGDLIFFGSFVVLGVVGGWHQDNRKISELGDSYQRLIDETSFMPGAAIWAGRQRWEPGDTPWRSIVIGVVLTIMLVTVHPMFFGGHPLSR